jgi:hypothetical protein
LCLWVNVCDWACDGLVRVGRDGHAHARTHTYAHKNTSHTHKYKTLKNIRGLFFPGCKWRAPVAISTAEWGQRCRRIAYLSNRCRNRGGPCVSLYIWYPPRDDWWRDRCVCVCMCVCVCVCASVSRSFSLCIIQSLHLSCNHTIFTLFTHSPIFSFISLFLSLCPSLLLCMYTYLHRRFDGDGFNINLCLSGHV